MLYLKLAFLQLQYRSVENGYKVSRRTKVYGRRNRKNICSRALREQGCEMLIAQGSGMIVYMFTDPYSLRHVVLASVVGKESCATCFYVFVQCQKQHDLGQHVLLDVGRRPQTMKIKIVTRCATPHLDVTHIPTQNHVVQSRRAGACPATYPFRGCDKCPQVLISST